MLNVNSGRYTLPEFFYFWIIPDLAMRRIYLPAVLVLFTLAAGAQVKILFDANHAESAANADWVIDADAHNLGWGSSGGYTSGSPNESNPQRLPTPTQTAVTSSTAETYWDGALSYWGLDCVKRGYWVETLPFGTAITYGTAAAQDLSNYNIFVVDEPNTLFTSTEKAAIMHFVQNGGSLLMVSDHDGSDRNSDNWDSPAIWNNFISSNGVSNNSLGFNFALENFSGTFTNIVTAPSDTLLHGPYGNVTKVQWSNGTCMNLYPSQNASVKAVVYRNGAGQADTAALVVHARVGCGKVAAFSDSSPADDGTGDPNDNSLYNGYITDAAGNHQKLLMNMMVWLAQPDCSMGVNEIAIDEQVSMYPNPSNGKVIFETSQKTDIKIYNAAGQQVQASFTAEGEKQALNTILPAGVYECFVKTQNGISSKKLVIIP